MRLRKTHHPYLLLLALSCAWVSHCTSVSRRPTPIGELPRRISAQVVHVEDGDTFTALTQRMGKVRVRFHGIDTPEMDQPFGEEAKQFTRQRTFNRQVTLLPRDWDKYGRLVAVVILEDGTELNRALVKAGLAWWYRRYAPDDERLARAEVKAQQAGKGLWGAQEPTPPWVWRRR